MLLNERPEGPPVERWLFCKVDCLKWLGLGLGLRLGQMCRNVDHVNVDLPTHSTIPPSNFRHSQRCNSRSNGRRCSRVDPTSFNLMLYTLNYLSRMVNARNTKIAIAVHPASWKTEYKRYVIHALMVPKKTTARPAKNKPWHGSIDRKRKKLLFSEYGNRKVFL